MKLLDALVAPARTEERYGFNQWVQEFFTFGGHRYGLGYRTSYGNEKAEPIGNDFAGYVQSALKANGVVFGLERVRSQIFSEARIQFQQLNDGTGRPGKLFGTTDLGILEHPWPGATTGDLLTRMILDADLAGNSYTVVLDGEAVRLRPDWVEIVLAPRVGPWAQDSSDVTVGMSRVGYFYYEGGIEPKKVPAFFLADEVAHFAPQPDPEATYRGMSWLTPVIREIQADKLTTAHKVKFFENAATPNVAVSLPKEVTPEQFKAFVAEMDRSHKGVHNAYKTLYTGGGADVTVIGSSLQQLDFKVTQGAGETRIAQAAGVHPVVAALSEGMQGASLNAGNFSAARRLFANGTMAPLWRNMAGSLETLVPPPAGARLWYDIRDVAFLREDEKDAAQIQQMRAQTIRTLLDAGYDPDAAVGAVENDDMGLLTGRHSGLFSVQLQPAGAGQPANGSDGAAG